MNRNAKSKIPSRDFITALAKGLDVLRAFNQDDPKMSVADLASKLDISRASARRFLLTLEDLGYLTKEAQRYRLTSKVLDLGVSYFSSMPLSAIAQPYIDELTRQSQESCSLGILENDMAVFIARAQSHWIMNIGINVGTQLPAHSTAIGRVLLANMNPDYQKHYLDNTELRKNNSRTITDKKVMAKVLAKTKKQGFSIVNQELEEGLRAIAVPISRDGIVIAAMSLISLVNRASMKQLKEEFLPLLNEAAANISADISLNSTALRSM